MKLIFRIALTVVLMLTVSGSLFAAKKARKLPADAYVKSAKIEILSGDLERYKTAIAMLDSLFMHYGPHSEALNLMASIYVDYTDKEPDPVAKFAYIEKLVAYNDSLRMTCNNKDIKKKYRKDCKKLIEKADSTEVKYWREFYNAGIEQLNYSQELSKQLETVTDSVTRKYSENSLHANIDSCIANMRLAITIDPTKYDPYLACGSAYEYANDFENAIVWLTKGLDKVTDRKTLVLQIAYDYIRMDRYREAIPFFREYVELAPDDDATMYNLSICYNNSQMYDSAVVVYRKILAIDPENTEVLTGVGRYFNQAARQSSDSATYYRQEGNVEAADMWRAKQQDAFDSSSTYFKRVFDLKPDDAFAAEEYGVVAAIRGTYGEAAVAFTRLTELDPERSENWTWLGDCYLNLKQFEKAIPAYEKVVELDPSSREIWERLRDLYAETGDKAKAANAEKKLSEL
jgi:tetratricopeptide (TPR) repeat protein